MTNKVKPFYIKITDDMTPQMVQDTFDRCVDAGVVANDCIENTAKKNDGWGYFGSIHDWELFGVCKMEGTWLGDDPKYMNCNTAQEITLDQLDEWLGLESKKPESGRDVYIAQINTLAGVEEQRYFIHQYWCDSGHQNQLLELGILFTDKEDAITKTKSLLGIPHETPEQKAERERQYAVYDMCSDLDNHTDDARFWCEQLYDAGYRKQ